MACNLTNFWSNQTSSRGLYTPAVGNLGVQKCQNWLERLGGAKLQVETEATSLRGSVGSVTVAAEKPQARRCPRVIRSRVSVCVCVWGGWWWKEMGLVWAGSLRGMGWRGVALEQAERRGEKKLGEIKGPRPLLPRCRGWGGSWRGSNGRYELTAFLQASGGGGGRWLHRKKPGAPSASPEARAPATRRPGDHNAPAPLLYCRRPFFQDSAISPGSGGAGSQTSPPLPRPALPCPAPRDPARPGPAQPLSTHGSDSSGGSSPAPASPPPTPGCSSAAGSEPRGAWRVGTRGAFAPGTGSWASPRLLAALEPF